MSSLALLVVISLACIVQSMATSSISVADVEKAPSSPWTTVFLDTFDRPDGPIGSNYTTGLNGTPPLAIHHHAVCSNTQAIAIYNTSLSTAVHRVLYEFTPHSVEGFETYVLAIATETLQPSVPPSSVWIIGCDGGYSQTCTPTVRALDNSVHRTGSSFAMTVGATYGIEVIVKQNSVHLNITLPGGTPGPGLSVDTASRQTRFLGLLVGRGLEEASCATAFAIERSAAH
eukprot:m.60101 g.60101  ORF g.60101 m.60101 type:complete len:230 (-) comp15739_c0_seq1:372-1061(-)